MASNYSGVTRAGKTYDVDEDGVVIRHLQHETGKGAKRYQHFTIENEGGSPVFFENGEDVSPDDVSLPATDLAYVTVSNNADATTYRIAINGAVNLDYVSDAGDGDADIIAGLQAVADASALIDAEVEGTRLAIRPQADSEGDETPFTIAVSIQAGGGSITHTEPGKSHSDALSNGQISQEWTQGFARTALKCESGLSTKVRVRYASRKAEPINTAR